MNKAQGKLVLIPVRAKVIKLISRLAAEGLGKRTIAKELKRRRIKTSAQSLGKILTSKEL